jgi:hypothetical protein
VVDEGLVGFDSYRLATEVLPAAGLTAATSVGGVMMYAAQLVSLAASRVAFLSLSMSFALSATTAKAFNVSVAPTVMGPAYTGELVVGGCPSVV